MVQGRNRNIVIKSQFNIHGSRGKSVRNFISGYVARSTATDRSLGYDPQYYQEPGDGVAFTLTESAISREETLRVADHVEDLFQEKDRAIQQMVISFDPAFLLKTGLVTEDTQIEKRGDYAFQYDDVRLRYALQQGLQAMVDNEGYRDGCAIGAIQHDTTHLHAHVVVYEDAEKIARKRGKEEKGVLKQSSLNLLAKDIERTLEQTELQFTPCRKTLFLEKEESQAERYQREQLQEQLPSLDLSQLNQFMDIIKEQEEEEKKKRQEQEKVVQEQDLEQSL